MKKNRIAFVVVLGFILLCAAAFCCFLSFLYLPPSKNGQMISYRLVVPSGATIKGVGNELAEHGIIKSSTLFYFAAKHENLVLKAGIYHFSDTMTLKEIFQLLQSGKQEYISTRIAEGLTLTKIGTLLQENNICSETDFIEAAKNKELIDSYGIPFNSMEGYLFPDTYYFTADMQAEKVVSVMVDNFFSHIKSDDELSKLEPDELFKTVILASIVEREYRNADEAPLIASVFTNRLKRNIGLYSCATIEYIITEIKGLPHPDVITNDDLKIDSPYNTYKWAGLTPGPISNPGMIALKAAANPPKTKYYYFRLIDKDTGTHHFSETFDEHIDSGKQYYTKKSAGN